MPVIFYVLFGLGLFVVLTYTLWYLERRRERAGRDWEQDL